MPSYYTPDEVAQELRVTRRTVYEWLRTGRLHGVRAGKWWRVRREDLEAFLGDGAKTREPVALPTPTEESREAAGKVPSGKVSVVQAPWEVPSSEVIDPEQARKNQAARELLREWMEEGDEEEQRETLEFLMKALDEDRPSYRKLFP